MNNEPRARSAEAALSEFLLAGYPLGCLRLLLVAAVLVLLMYLGKISFESIDMNAVLEGWKAQSPLLGFIQIERIPDFMLKVWAFLASGPTLRYLYLPLAALVGASLLGSRYIQDTFLMGRMRQALRYLISALFTIGYSRLTVSEGELKLKPEEINWLDVIGGPAVLKIHPGNLVLLEKLQGGNAIGRAGKRFVNRLQRLKAVISLEDQHDFIDSVAAKTKDGIPIVVRHIHFRYRLRTGPGLGDYTVRTPDNPYPFAEAAVLAMAYNRLVTSEGLMQWREAVRQIIEGTITEYIYQHQVDHLTAPSFEENDPRIQITRMINSPQTRARLAGIGASLLWFDMGHFDIAEEKVKDRRLDTWGAKWAGDAAVIKSYGEAQRDIYREIGRAEGQAEMLMSIVNALEAAGLPGNDVESMRRLLLVRTTQIIEAYAQKREQLPPPDEKRPSRQKKP